MRNEVKRLNLGVEPEAAVSNGTLLQTEYSASLLFSAVRPTADGKRIDAGTAVLTFNRPRMCEFGLPNDEALAGHPILGAKNCPTGILEVLHSDWLAEAEGQNQVSFPDSSFAGVRHFIVPMHDSTFECLADGVSIEVGTEPYDVVFRRVAERAIGER